MRNSLQRILIRLLLYWRSARALGTQIGGSIIRPAAYCGIVGLKPSQGRISCYGTFPRRWETDHVGILTRSVEDSALLLEVLAGHDLNDRSTTTIPVPPYTAALSRLAPPTLGLFKEFFHERAEKEAKENIDKIVKQLTDAGARVLETKLPRTFRAIAPTHKLVQISELAAGLKDIFETRIMDIRPMTRGGVAAGLLIPASSYTKA